MTRRLNLLMAVATGILCCLVHTAAAQVSPAEPPRPPTLDVPLAPIVTPPQAGRQGGGADAQFRDDVGLEPIPDELPTPVTQEEGSTPADTGSPSCDCAACAPRAGLAGVWGRFRARMQYSHWGYCQYFHERPFGSLCHAHMQMQIANAALEKMVLYEYDFFDGTDAPDQRLKPRGRDQLRMIVQLMENTGCPLTIERTGNTVLDEARRQNVLRRLREELGYPASDASVVVGKPTALGLLQGGAIGQRSEPEANYNNLLQQSLRQGNVRLRTGSSSIGRSSSGSSR